MKLAIFLAFLTSLSLSAQSNEGKLTVSFQNVPLSEAIKQIENVSDYTFFYDTSKINADQKVSLQANQTPVKQAMKLMFAKTDINWDIKNNQIILSSKGAAKTGAKITVQGNVTDESGEPLPGVTVVAKDNPAIVTATDIDGRYELTVPEKNTTLEYRFIGMAPIEEAVGSRKIINVVMSESSTQLQDVVVVGYGVQKRASVVAAITSVRPDQLSVGTTRSLSNDLAGNIAGVIAVQRSGEPGYDDSEFWIRGMSSFKGNGAPLVLVDGIERSLNNIDIAEIESFSVLKDASASAVYGVRGANGVILITTKKGKAGKTTVNVSVEHSFTRPEKLPQFLGAADYLTLLNNISIQDTGQERYSRDLINKYRTGYDPELYPDVNWIEAITKDYAHNTRATLDLSGGNERLRYSVVAAYYNESGITETDKRQNYNSNLTVNRFNLRTNVDMNVTPTTLLNVNVGGYLQTRNAPKEGIDDVFSAAFKATPFAVPTIYENGMIPKPRENENPWAKLTQSGFYREGRSKLESLFSVEQDLHCITDGLKAKVIFSYDYYSRYGVDRGKAPRYYYPATQRDPVTGELQTIVLQEGDEFLGYNRWEEYGNYSTYLEANISYSHHFGPHQVDGLLLYNQRNYDDGDQVSYRTQGLAGRASYVFDGRYIAEFNFGYNGSENFAKGHRFGFFPSAALGWIVSQEKFMQGTTPYIQKLKLRASYGLAGNDRFYNDDGSQKRFGYITTIESTEGYKWGNSNTFYEKGGLREGAPGAPDLTWEKVKKANIGLEMRLFNMLEFQVDFFHERREDIFMQRRNYPNSAGFPSLPWANYGIVTNKGFEVEVNLNKRINEDLAFSVRGNVTYAKNKIVEQDEDLQVVGTYRSSTGKSVGTIFGLVSDGLYTEDDFADLSTGQLKPGLPTPKFADRVYPGDIRYKDLNGDNEITETDKTAIGGTVNPELVYGFGANINWRGFDLGIFFQGNGRTYRVIGDGQKNFLPGSTLGAEGNIFKNASDAWTIDNPSQDAFYPRLHMGYNAHNTQTSDWWLKDMSMLRLKNLEIGYSFPSNLIKKAAMEYARVFLRGTNICHFSNFKLWDPELSTNNGLKYPIMSTYSIGLQVRF